MLLDFGVGLVLDPILMELYNVNLTLRSYHTEW